MSNISKLVLIRHGQSTYNEKNLFTGWKDVELTSQGIQEAHDSSNLINNITFSHAFTSHLRRAKDTLKIVLNDIKQDVKIIEDLALNERDYGDLIGQNKTEAAKIYGEKQIQIWRRSYDTPPPNGESLKMTADRTIPYFKNKIEPLLNNNNNIIISAHGNSIRAIVMYLHDFNSEQILKTEIGWCEPWIYTFSNGIKTDFKIMPRPNSKSNSNLPNILETTI